MSDSFATFLGVSAAVINSVGFFPYLFDVLKRKTKPERASWWIWTALGVIGLIASFSAGFTWGLIFVTAQTISVSAIAILSIWYGYGRLHRRDYISLFFAAVGIVLWQLTSQPIVALLIVVAIEATGLWLTLDKTWKNPYTETKIAWILSAISGGLALVSIQSTELTKIVYPAYLFLGNTLVTMVILYRRPKVKIGENSAR